MSNWLSRIGGDVGGFGHADPPARTSDSMYFHRCKRHAVLRNPFGKRSISKRGVSYLEFAKDVRRA